MLTIMTTYDNDYDNDSKVQTDEPATEMKVLMYLCR